MTTVREVRVQAASHAIDTVTMMYGDGLSQGHLRMVAEAVIDALFPADPYIDNAEAVGAYPFILTGEDVKDSGF